MIHAAIFGFPVVMGGIGHPILPANLFDLAAAHDLYQDLHGLRFCETTFTYDGSPLHRKYAEELQPPLGPNQRVLTQPRETF